jgi:hypothetical protein
MNPLQSTLGKCKKIYIFETIPVEVLGTVEHLQQKQNFCCRCSIALCRALPNTSRKTLSDLTQHNLLLLGKKWVKFRKKGLRDQNRWLREPPSGLIWGVWRGSDVGYDRTCWQAARWVRKRHIAFLAGFLNKPMPKGTQPTKKRPGRQIRPSGGKHEQLERSAPRSSPAGSEQTRPFE